MATEFDEVHIKKSLEIGSSDPHTPEYLGKGVSIDENVIELFEGHNDHSYGLVKIDSNGIAVKAIPPISSVSPIQELKINALGISCEGISASSQKHDNHEIVVNASSERGIAVKASSKLSVGIMASSIVTAIKAESGLGIGIHASGGTYAGKFEGDIMVTGQIKTPNADCAEYFEAKSKELIEPGTVMVVNNESQLELGVEPYDKHVVGVVSGASNIRPGLILGKQLGQPNSLLIALLGRVYCKVDADYAAIEVGDLLTTSLTPGHAMKATDPIKAFGTTLGKAMASLREGHGMIPILVALQ